MPPILQRPQSTKACSPASSCASIAREFKRQLLPGTASAVEGARSAVENRSRAADARDVRLGVGRELEEHACSTGASSCASSSPRTARPVATSTRGGGALLCSPVAPVLAGGRRKSSRRWTACRRGASRGTRGPASIWRGSGPSAPRRASRHALDGGGRRAEDEGARDGGTSLSRGDQLVELRLEVEGLKGGEGGRAGRAASERVEGRACADDCVRRGTWPSV